MGLSIGIDLGTTNSVAAVVSDTDIVFTSDEDGYRTHPSVVSFPPGSPPIAGGAALPFRASDPLRTVYSAKRLIGQNVKSATLDLMIQNLRYDVVPGENDQALIVIDDKQLTIPEVSSEVLKFLKKRTQEMVQAEVTDAVITVPANFTDAQRRATRQAGDLAGLNVLRLINEPTAAALAYGFSAEKDCVVAIYDFGGGTFDVSLLRIKDSMFEVLASDGDFFLGGDDCDMAVATYLAQEVNTQFGVQLQPRDPAMTKLFLAAEQIKCHLSDYDEAEGTIDDLPIEGEIRELDFKITRDRFEQAISGYVEKTIEICNGVITASGLSPSDVDDIVCVGGSTRIPYVRRSLAQLFGKPPLIDINPDEVVAQGAAIQAAALAISVPPPISVPGAPSPPPMPSQLGGRTKPLLMDVVPASLGLATAGGFSSPIVEKNAPIPIRVERGYSTSRDNQDRVVIDICRGESNRYDENELLGSVVLDNIDPAPRGKTKVIVTFIVDSDGILSVIAKNQRTGDKQDVTLNVLGAPIDKPQPKQTEHPEEDDDVLDLDLE